MDHPTSSPEQNHPSLLDGSAPAPTYDKTRPVLIFDGVCEICNATVDFVLKWEKKPPVILFTANENPPGRALLQQHGQDPEAVTTVFFLENGKLYQRSTAALRLARYLRFPMNLLYGYIIVPRFIRDFVYNIIARNRYRWFGKKDTCRIPSPEEMARFLLE
jgi:predicted DCC family thiol-disulfide oxidoreductase YuxK